MDWDGFQREALAALGCQLYDIAAARSAIAEAPIAAATLDAAAPALQRALARAAGVPVAALPALPTLEALRSPAAKRALWPRLRALRAARVRG